MPGTGRERGGPEEAGPQRRARERASPDRQGARGGTSRQSHPNGDEGEADESRRLHRGSEPDSSRRRPAITARKAARCAALHVQELTGEQPEGVTSLEQSEDGWRVGVEVVETHRIPDSTDILAVYRVEVDEEGELVSYHRDRRYYRGRADEQ
jgi:hypothetical protein